MSHGRNKPGKEKRKPKQSKASMPKVTSDSEVLTHVAQHPRPDEGK